MKLFFIRHGATLGNEKKKYIGKNIDEPLSDHGAETLRERTGRNYYPDADMLFSSEMLRCRQSAGIIYPGKPIIIAEGLTETDFGEFEGKTYEELKDDARYIKWIDGRGRIAAPGAEATETFDRRVEKGFFSIIEKGEDKKTAAVLSGGVIMNILSRFYGGDYYDYMLRNGEMIEADISGGRITEIKKL